MADIKIFTEKVFVSQTELEALKRKLSSWLSNSAEITRIAFVSMENSWDVDFEPISQRTELEWKTLFRTFFEVQGYTGVSITEITGIPEISKTPEEIQQGKDLNLANMQLGLTVIGVGLGLYALLKGRK